ncbi:MAG: PEP-CTERM sorting domain-containing protein [Verrucomicrobiae bacterium]|nr:PEP-CTERM sorting domain-containing protein [Verrucomicrobiae bacterium]
MGVALNSANAFFSADNGISIFTLSNGNYLGNYGTPSSVGGLVYDTQLRLVNADGNKLYTRSPVTGWDFGKGLANSPTGARGVATLGNWVWVLDGAGTTIKIMTNSPTGYVGVDTITLDHEYYGMGNIRGRNDLLLVDANTYVDVLHLHANNTNVSSVERWAFTGFLHASNFLGVNGSFDEQGKLKIGINESGGTGIIAIHPYFVPEPATGALFVVGMGWVIWGRRNRSLGALGCRMRASNAHRHRNAHAFRYGGP